MAENVNDLERKVAKTKLKEYGIGNDAAVVEQPKDDDLYTPPKIPVRKPSKPKRKTAKVTQTQPDLLKIPDFLRRATTNASPPVMDQLVALAESVKVGTSENTDPPGAPCVVMTEKQVDAYVKALHKTLGDTMEKGGLIWTTALSCEAKEYLRGLISKALFSKDGADYLPINIKTNEEDA